MASVKNTAKTFPLNTGAQIPAVGLGTWKSKPNEVTQAVEAALARGYRHIDTAYAYGNEKEVGQGIKASGVPRDQLWLTTKLDNPWHKKVSEAIDWSLKNLQTEYVDLYLMHWPSSTNPENKRKHYEDWDYVDTWREMQKLVATGKVRNIGVSNFQITHLERLLKASSTTVVPAVNQIELHPANPSPKLVAYCQEKGIHTTGYSPLGSADSPLASNETLRALAEAKGKTVAQVLIMWGIQRGYSVLPKSVTKSRIDANFDLDGWSLTDEEFAKISAIKDRFRVCDGAFLPDGVVVFTGDDE